ncbi:MAG: Phosphocarrier protein HPr [Chlamydiia bacterium]|nr:Phosphocarrier protein HPr [Chlamydiia bacterium]MCH9615896.1 Phosphocarrier protein HPr [Chlamydiia bacterium]MCH9628701.1 Phosphocarrier protein HPr [Chlamydiia bacterium]
MSKKVKKAFVVLNEKGLHTRPATELVKCATTFRANILLSYQDLSVNGKSLLGILMLAAARGAKIKVEAEGEDAQAAVEALIALSKDKFKIKY